MSVILAAPNNKIAMAAPGRPLLAGPLPGTVPGGGGSTPSGGVTTNLTSIAGLTGWWDAGEAAGVLDPTGAPLAMFGASAAAVADKSGAGTALTVWHRATSGTTPPIAAPRLNGLLGGLGRKIVTSITDPFCRKQQRISTYVSTTGSKSWPKVTAAKGQWDVSFGN
jgi:hypothetical protein